MKKTLSVWSITGIVLCIASAALTYVHYESGMIWWLGVGGTMGVGFFAILSAFQKGEAVSLKPEFEGVKASLEAQLKTAQAAIEKEISERKGLAETFRKKLQEAHEKCDSYKKLVDVHQFENGKLRQEAKGMSDDLLSKTRRIAELELYLEEPKALPGADKELEFLYNQMKKQVEEKSRLLEQTRSELLQVENKFHTLQKEHEEKIREVSSSEISLTKQLSEVEEEKQKLETELTGVQHLVTQFSEVEKEKQKLETELAGAQQLVTQLSEVAEEKHKLETELASAQQLVTQLSEVAEEKQKLQAELARVQQIVARLSAAEKEKQKVKTELADVQQIAASRSVKKKRTPSKKTVKSSG